MPKAALTTEGDGKAVAPEAADLVPRRADLLIEYIAGAAQSFDAYARSLPPWQDLLTRDFPDVYERMLLDPVVHASARVIKLSVLADDITPRPAVDDQDDPDFDRAKELADFCADVQGGMKRSLEDVWYEHLDGVFTGSRVSEKVARVQDGGPHAGKLVWDRINPKPTWNIAYVLDPFGNLVGLLTRRAGEGWGGVGSGLVDRDDPNLLPREKFLILSWDPRDGDPRGRALLRHVYEPWWHKQQALSQWLKFLAQTAVPSLFATTPQGAGVLPPQDALGNPTGAQATSPQQQLLNQLVAFQGGTAMVAAAGTVLQVIQAAGDGSVFSRRIDYADACIARTLTLQTLATIEAKHGTRAQAEVHQDSLDLGVDYVRRVSCRVIREDVYRPLIRYNWGDDAADRLCPYASMTAVAKQDLNTTLPAYASVGYQLAPDQLPAVDEELGLPVRKEQPPEQQPPPGGGNPPGNPPDGNQPPGGADQGLSKSTVPPAVFAATDFSLPWEELSGLSREELLSLLADAALQSRLSIPADEAADAPFYSPDQLRDEQGRWTSGAGGLSPAEHGRNRSAAADAVRAFAGGTTRPTEDEVRAVAGHLARLTVAQLHALKAEHGLKASAPDKAALVAKLALRFTSHRQNSQQEGLTAQQKESKIPVGSEELKPAGGEPVLKPMRLTPLGRLYADEAAKIREKAIAGMRAELEKERKKNMPADYLGRWERAIAQAGEIDDPDFWHSDGRRPAGLVRNAILGRRTQP